MNADLVATFLAAAPPGFPLTDATVLGQELRAMFDAGRTAWQGVPLDAADFVAFVAERSAGKLPPAAYAADLYLAGACARRAEGATDAFCRSYGGEIERAAGRLGSSPAFVQEIRQAVCEKLFVNRTGGVGKIAEYGGRSALATWVHVAATRLAINLRIKERDRSEDARGDEDAPPADPEMEYLKRRYKSEFEAALLTGVRNLSAEERELLRWHFVDGMTVDRLGERLNVGRSTAARRLASARTALLAHTYDALRARLKLSASELDSLGGLVRSRIELSLAGLLATIPGRAEERLHR